MLKEMLESPLVPQKLKDALGSSELKLEDVWEQFEVVKEIGDLEARDERKLVDASDPLMGMWNYGSGPGTFNVIRSAGDRIRFGEGNTIEDLKPTHTKSPIDGPWMYASGKADKTYSFYELRSAQADTIQFVEGQVSGILRRGTDKDHFEGDLEKSFAGKIRKMRLEFLPDGTARTTTFLSSGGAGQHIASRPEWYADIAKNGFSLYFKESGPYLILNFMFKNGKDIEMRQAWRSGRLFSNPPLEEELNALWSVSLDGSDKLSTLKTFWQNYRQGFGFACACQMLPGLDWTDTKCRDSAEKRYPS